MKTMFAALAFLNLVSQAHASDLREVSIDPNTTSMENCAVIADKPDPAGVLTYKMNGQTKKRFIYSDLCGISAQWISKIYVNRKDEIVGIALANTHAADGTITISDLWVEIN